MKKDKPEIEKYASNYNDFKKEQFDKLQHQSDEEPVLVCGIYVGWTKWLVLWNRSQKSWV